MNVEPIVGALIAGIVFILTQITKESFPDFMSKYSKWVTLTLGALGGILAVVAFLAVNGGSIPAQNEWDAVLVILNQIIVGVGIGIAPSGLYNMIRPVAPTAVRSSDEILVARTPATMAGEVAVPVTKTETEVETVSVTDEATVTLKPKKTKRV